MKKNSSLLLIFPAAVPLLLILFSYLKGSWGWTLVNDYQYITMGTNFWDKLGRLYIDFMSMGQLKWTQLLRYDIVYTLFAKSPKAFFIYEWFEILAMFGVWGLLAYRLTGKKITFLLMPAAVLTSRCFYDAFFFPTLGDNCAMLFFGLGLLFLVKAESLTLGLTTNYSKNNPWHWPLLLVLFILALGVMEFTLAGIMSAGFSLCWLYKIRHEKHPKLLVTGIFLVLAGLLYGIFLKLFIAHGYSSGYRFTDFHKIFYNLLIWGKEVFKMQALWLLAAGVIIYKTWGRTFWSRYGQAERFGIILGVLMYTLWLAVLLPWHANGYHAVPLIIVFGFLMAVVLAGPLEDLEQKWFGIFAIGALVFNVLVSQQEIYVARVYNADIQRFLYFAEGNSSFQQAAMEGKAFCNQFEPAESLAHWANKQAGLELPKFAYDPDILSAQKKGAEYYVFSTWGSPLGTYLTSPGWEPVSVGEFFKVYEKRTKD